MKILSAFKKIKNHKKKKTTPYMKYCMEKSKDSRISTIFPEEISPVKTAYARQFNAGDFSSDFFIKSDGDIYSLAMKFYNNSSSLIEKEKDIMNLKIHFDTLAKQLLGKAKGNEKKGEKRIVKSFSTATKISNRNVLKEVAWAVTHSLVIGFLWSDKVIYSIIPTNNSTNSKDWWNKYITDQSDISDDIKKMFIIDDNGNCLFREINSSRFYFKQDFPKEDPVFDDSTNVEVLELEPIKSEIIEMDNNFKSIVDDYVTIDDPVENDKYVQNNEKYHNSVYRISHFTELVKKEKYNTLYSEYSEMNGMILAEIFDNDKPVSKFLLDDCTIIGDTLRVIDCDDIQKNGVYNATYIPISDDKNIRKAITGSINDSDRKNIMKDIPSFYLNKSDSFALVEMIDMKGLKSGDITGLPFGQWKKFVNNLKNILFDPDIPNARYRLINYINPGKFTLKCDTLVKYPFNTDIEFAKTNIDSVNAGTEIIFDNSKPKGEKINIHNLVTYVKN